MPPINAKIFSPLHQCVHLMLDDAMVDQLFLLSTMTRFLRSGLTTEMDQGQSMWSSKAMCAADILTRHHGENVDSQTFETRF